MIASLEQWSQLAKAWELCEGGGLVPRHLEAYADRLRAPCLIVGSGHGLLCTALRDLGCNPVYGVDFCLSMVYRALERREMHSIVAEAQMLPFADEAFESLVCATGVLDPKDPKGLSYIIKELARVVRKGGFLLLSFFQASNEMLRIGNALGIMVDGDQRHDRIASLWQARYNIALMREKVAEWTDCSLLEARKRLTSYGFVISKWFELLTEFAALTASPGDEESTVVRSFDWTLSGFTSGANLALSQTAGIEVVRSDHDIKAATRLMLLKKSNDLE